LRLHVTKHIVELLFWYNNKANCSVATDQKISSVYKYYLMYAYIYTVHIHNLLKTPYQNSILFTLK